MKRRFNRILAVFLLQALLLTPLPAAWAEEWEMDPEPVSPYGEEVLEEFDEYILFEEEIFEEPEEEPAPAEEEELTPPEPEEEEILSVTWAGIEDGQLFVGYETNRDAFVTVRLRADSEAQEVLLEETRAVYPDTQELRIPLDGLDLPDACLIEATIDNGSAWHTLLVRIMPESEMQLTFDAQPLEEDICFYAELNEDGDLDFCLLLPEGAESGAYKVTADDGKSDEPAALTNTAGEHVLRVFTGVRPHELSSGMTVSVVHGDKTQTVSVLDYLQQVPDQYEELDLSASIPTRKAQYSGAIAGIDDWHAGLALEDDTALLLFFRAEAAKDLQLACEGHEVTAPKQEAEGLWSVRVGGIRAAELPADLVITAEKGEESVQLQFPPFCYAAAHWEDDTPFVLLCKAMTAVLTSSETDANDETL